VGLAADIAHFDVFHAIGYEAYWALGNIHSGLVQVDPQGNVIPDMATSWDIKDEGRTYIFHLHKGIQFHDGTPADAAAIKWNIEYILDPANTADARIFFRPIEAVEALDDATLQIRLQEPSADFLMVLAGYRLASLWPPRPRCNAGGRIINFIQSEPDRLSLWSGRLGNRSSWRKTSISSSLACRISTASYSRP